MPPQVDPKLLGVKRRESWFGDHPGRVAPGGPLQRHHLQQIIGAYIIIADYNEVKIKTKLEPVLYKPYIVSVVCGSISYATSVSEVANLALPGVGLLETVLAHTVVHDRLFDFVTSGHDEWTVLVNGLIERFSRDLIERVNNRGGQMRTRTYKKQFSAVFQGLQAHTVLVRLRAEYESVELFVFLFIVSSLDATL